jgi:hypothetical protein
MEKALPRLIACLILGAVAAILGWLICAKVMVSHGHVFLSGSAERFERGWPFVFVDSFEHSANGDSPPESVAASFYAWALVADVAIAAVVILIVAIVVRRRLLRQRPWQISVRSALVAIALIAGISGWLAREYRLWQRERQAIAELPRWELREEYRGPQWLLRVCSKEKLPIFHHVAEAMTPNLRRTASGLRSLSDSDLRSFTAALPSLPWLRAVEVVDTVPSGFDEFDQWKTIEKLDLSPTFATDDVLRRIARMPRLQTLSLYMREEFTAAGLAHLAGCESLEEIVLDSTPVTDQGIAHLARLPRLRVLRLNQTSITDASIEFFCQMHSLEKLEIYATHISDHGARRLIDLPALKELWLPFDNVSEGTAELLRTKIAWVQRY